MKQRKTFFLLASFLVCIYILFFQPEWLGIILFEYPVFPLGSLISWFIIADFILLVDSLFPVQVETKTGRNFKRVIRVFVWFGILWGAFSYLLSGNWSWSFRSLSRFYIWLIYTSVLLLIPLTVFIILIFKRISNKKI